MNENHSLKEDREKCRKILNEEVDYRYQFSKDVISLLAIICNRLDRIERKLGIDE